MWPQGWQLLVGPGHVTSGLTAIGKRRIKLVLRVPRGITTRLPEQLPYAYIYLFLLKSDLSTLSDHLQCECFPLFWLCYFSDIKVRVFFLKLFWGSYQQDIILQGVFTIIFWLAQSFKYLKAMEMSPVPKCYNEKTFKCIMSLIVSCLNF